MKGALAALLLAVADLREQDAVRVRFGIVPDEESEEEIDRGGDLLVEKGFVGDFAITGEPTDMHIGVAAKGVLAMRLQVSGRAAHGATPWLGENAILRAIDVFRGIQSLPFASQSSELFDRPSINLGRILGGDALNKVPDTCFIDVDVRYLPEQEPDEILAEVAGLPDAEVISTFRRPPASVDPESAYVRSLCAAAARHHADGVTSVGRDGASDAVSFLRRRDPGGRVRPARRRPPRPRRVGLGELAVELPQGDRRLRHRPSDRPRRAPRTEPGRDEHGAPRRRARRATATTRPRATTPRADEPHSGHLGRPPEVERPSRRSGRRARGRRRGRAPEDDHAGEHEMPAAEAGRADDEDEPEAE